MKRKISGFLVLSLCLLVGVVVLGNWSIVWATDYESDLRFQFNATELGVWPVDRLPADIIQPEKGILLDEVQIFDLGDEGFQYVINYEYDGLSDQDIIDYMQ